MCILCCRSSFKHLGISITYSGNRKVPVLSITTKVLASTHRLQFQKSVHNIIYSTFLWPHQRVNEGEWPPFYAAWLLWTRDCSGLAGWLQLMWLIIVRETGLLKMVSFCCLSIHTYIYIHLQSPDLPLLLHVWETISWSFKNRFLSDPSLLVALQACRWEYFSAFLAGIWMYRYLFMAVATVCS